MRWRSLPCFFCSSLIFGCSSCIAFEERRAFTVRGNISVLTMMVKAMMPIPALENRVARLFKTVHEEIDVLVPDRNVDTRHRTVRVSSRIERGRNVHVCLRWQVCGRGLSRSAPALPGRVPAARFEVTEPDRIRYRQMDCSAGYARWPFGHRQGYRTAPRPRSHIPSNSERSGRRTAAVARSPSGRVR